MNKSIQVLKNIEGDLAAEAAAGPSHAPYKGASSSKFPSSAQGAAPQDPKAVPALKARAEKMLFDASGSLAASGDDAVAECATSELLVNAKEAVDALFVEHGLAAVQASVGMQDKLDKEEAVGLLLADAVGHEIDAADARAVGKRANSKASEERAKLKKAAARAAANATNATKAAEKDVAKAAGLEQRLAELAKAAAAERAAILNATFDLKLPAPRRRRRVVAPRPQPVEESSSEEEEEQSVE